MARAYWLIVGLEDTEKRTPTKFLCTSGVTGSTMWAISSSLRLHRSGEVKRKIQEEVKPQKVQSFQSPLGLCCLLGGLKWLLSVGIPCYVTWPPPADSTEHRQGLPSSLREAFRCCCSCPHPSLQVFEKHSAGSSISFLSRSSRDGHSVPSLSRASPKIIIATLPGTTCPVLVRNTHFMGPGGL